MTYAESGYRLLLCQDGHNFRFSGWNIVKNTQVFQHSDSTRVSHIDKGNRLCAVSRHIPTRARAGADIYVMVET
jgi:hypothetical protein